MGILAGLATLLVTRFCAFAVPLVHYRPRQQQCPPGWSMFCWGSYRLLFVPGPGSYALHFQLCPAAPLVPCSPTCALQSQVCPAGLDSSNAARVVDILAGLAGAGMTVIITIHQPRPDILRLMNRMLLLSGNGQVTCCPPFTCWPARMPLHCCLLHSSKSPML